MPKHYDIDSIDDAHACAYKLGLMIREHVPTTARLKLIETLVIHLQQEAEKPSDRMCRMFQIGLSQGVADAHSEGTLERLRDAGSSS